ncbi:Phosphatidylinositol 3-kinase C2 domain [Trinorchestia longiramus]|nr:Phosphatidylinositol 3-kinase C2 domain [Trinorchestia longiramus]
MHQRISLPEGQSGSVGQGEGVVPPRPRRNTLGPFHSSPPVSCPVTVPRTRKCGRTASMNETSSLCSPSRTHFSLSAHVLSPPSSPSCRVGAWSPLITEEPQLLGSSPSSRYLNIPESCSSSRSSSCSPRPSSHQFFSSSKMSTLLTPSYLPAPIPTYTRPPPYAANEQFQDIIFLPTSPSSTMHFIMPNGVLIILTVSNAASLAEIKADLWEKAREYPLYGLLHDMNNYHFATPARRSASRTVSGPADVVELLEEEMTLKDVAPFLTFMKVIERKGNEAEKILNKDIGNLIGKNLADFAALKNPEVNEFRWKMKVLCDEAVKERAGRPWNQRVQYKYPCSIDPSPSMPIYLEKKLTEANDKHILVSVRFSFEVLKVESTFTLRVEPDILPNRLMEQALNKFNTLESSRLPVGTFNKANYIFKTVGREEYLVEEVPMFRYMIVQEHLAMREQHPLLVIVVERSLLDVDEDENQYMETGGPDSSSEGVRKSFSSMTLSKKKSLNVVSSWTVSENFRVELGIISKLNLIGQGNTMVRVVGGLYHGTLVLCEKQQTDLLQVSGDAVSIDKSMTFDIAVCDLPRSARLCLAILEESHPTVQQQQQQKKKANTSALPEDPRGVAWVNISVFDYRRGLRRGAMTLYCWSVQHNVDLPKPLGTVVSNPDHEAATAVTLTFPRYHQTCDLMYPAQSTLMDTAKQQPREQVVPTLEDRAYLKRIVKSPPCDPDMEIFEQDRKKLWNLRWYCATEMPNILPRLLDCVDWYSRIQVSQVTELLDQWPKMEPRYALELLDYNYAEPVVRDYAVECIAKFSDEDLLLYLLQLTQALKHENHLNCTLAEFLLHRALNNTKIGHFLFWHLRSEMHVPSVSIRFGLILETYCKGAQEHMKLLTKQLEALIKFRELRHRAMKLKSSKSRDALQELLRTKEMQAAYTNFRNLLDPTQNLSAIKPERCRSMDSKMAPLWLVFESEEDDDVSLLYKNGDDLRQDMLTLQTIRIMDNLWKKRGLDFKMNPYRCMSTANLEGLIEGVRHATTIANIQRDKGMLAVTCPFRKGSLLEWLRDKNPTEASLNKAVSEFTRSCAGYCVATYVLGIADRHSDNIMVMENGQLFHIDFGHILGHFKEKFGFKREHQPFVLTHDFIYVITKGSPNSPKKSDEFEKFKKNCEEAYMILREYGTFIISLFAMMISTGLQELQDERDLAYINDRLQLSLSDEEALQHFRKEFGEAMKNSWKTSLNWAFHAMAKDNR